MVSSKAWDYAGNFFRFSSINFLVLFTSPWAKGSLSSLFLNASFTIVINLPHSASTLGVFCATFAFFAISSLSCCTSFYKLALFLVNWATWFALSFSVFEDCTWSLNFLLNKSKIFSTVEVYPEIVGSIFFLTPSNFLCLFTYNPIF